MHSSMQEASIVHLQCARHCALSWGLNNVEPQSALYSLPWAHKLCGSRNCVWLALPCPGQQGLAGVDQMLSKEQDSWLHIAHTPEEDNQVKVPMGRCRVETSKMPDVLETQSKGSQFGFGFSTQGTALKLSQWYIICFFRNIAIFDI